MLAGCSSSTLLSPSHRLRSEGSTQFQACHFPLPSMNTQRLDIPCSFPRKDSNRSQPIRPVVSLSIEKPVDLKPSSCSLRQSIRLPPSATRPQIAVLEGRKEGKSLKRFAEQGLVDDSSTNRVKRKRSSGNDSGEGNDGLSLGQFGGGTFWFNPGYEVPRSLPGLNQPQVPFTLTCSGDEESVCFVPSEVISPPPFNNPWVDSVVTEITRLGNKETETTRGPPTKEASASSTSSESNSGSEFQLNQNPSAHETDNNGSENPHRCEETALEAEEEDEQEESRGFELVSLLTASVEAIGSRNIAAINHFIAKLGDLASLSGSPISRLIAYFSEGLALRVTRFWPHTFHISVPRDIGRADDESGTALRLLNQVSPIPKFIHFTSNEILLRAFEGKDRVHIIDFDIKQGLQWPSLFQSLASRTRPPSHVRITGIGESKQELNETGDRLSGFAEAMNLPFEFHPVVDRLEDVRLWMLHVKDREAVAVNCVFQLHKTLYDANGGALRNLLGLIQSTNPTIVVMAEQEVETNVPRLETRICNSLKYYAAIFDSLDFSLSLDSPVRIKIEEMFSKEIRNIVACEGMDWCERYETFNTWKRMMEHGGYRCKTMSTREVLQSQMLLKMYSYEDYSIEKQGQEDEAAAALTLSWRDQPLYTVSAWIPADAAGNSSSFSQPS